jgi:hypothetical protein
MPQKRRRKDDRRDEAEDFQMMDIDSTPPALPTATSTPSTLINISQWHIDDGQVHGTSALTSIEAAPSVTNSTAQAMFDYNVEVESTFYQVDEDVSPDYDPSAKKSTSGVSYFLLVATPAVLNRVLFIS